MQTVHWLGTGLSAVPGIRRLAQGDLPLVLWNRTVNKAEQAVSGIDKHVGIRQLDLDALTDEVQAGDILVSMLPGDWHVRIAELALSKDAHFVSSSYISPEMQALDGRAREKGLCLVNEVGLDPGIDHLMAHSLVHDYRNSSAYSPDNQVFFRSYCGGFPSIPNDFRYKFSWSPLGVLKALRSPSRSIRDGETVDVQRPWHAIDDYVASLPGGRKEAFEAYPNRDAVPFIAAYCVELEARANGRPVWHQSFAIDALGNENGTAMARLVSLTVSLAIEAVAAGKIPPGVSAAPADEDIVKDWFSTLQELGERVERIDHLA